MEQATKEVQLKHGVRDANGGVHKVVLLTEPMIEHEIKRDNMITRMRMSNSEEERVTAESETVQLLALICVCTVRFGELLKPELAHFRQLHRLDAQRLIAAFAELQGDMDEEPDGGN